MQKVPEACRAKQVIQSQVSTTCTTQPACFLCCEAAPERASLCLEHPEPCCTACLWPSLPWLPSCWRCSSWPCRILPLNRVSVLCAWWGCAGCCHLTELPRTTFTHSELFSRCHGHLCWELSPGLQHGGGPWYGRHSGKQDRSERQQSARESSALSC